MKKFLICLLVILSAQVVFAKSKPAPEGGYVGDLPNVLNGFQKSQPATSAPVFNSVDGFNNQNELKPIPRDNPAFVNIILKKDKTSQYINDLNVAILTIEKLQKSIDDEADIQKFNAEANYLNENVQYIRDKYQNKSEGSYISFKKLMQLNMHIQAISQLRAENQKYSPYLAYSGNGRIFSPNNISQQLEYLSKEINTTLIILKEAK